MNLGIKVIIVEETPVGTFEWEGEVTEITEAYIETKHERKWKTYPHWGAFNRAYMPTWTKHYFHPDGRTGLKVIT